MDEAINDTGIVGLYHLKENKYKVKYDRIYGFLRFEGKSMIGRFFFAFSTTSQFKIKNKNAVIYSPKGFTYIKNLDYIHIGRFKVDSVNCFIIFGRPIKRQRVMNRIFNYFMDFEKRMDERGGNHELLNVSKTLKVHNNEKISFNCERQVYSEFFTDLLPTVSKYEGFLYIERFGIKDEFSGYTYHQITDKLGQNFNLEESRHLYVDVCKSIILNERGYYISLPPILTPRLEIKSYNSFGCKRLSMESFTR
jgi:predicted nucleic-acid-binding Zn-ribbon protein